MKSRKKLRLQGYDYSKDGKYFITSVTQDRIKYFGNIENKRMLKNEYGEIVERQWNWLEEQYPYIKLHVFIVMPIHIHVIIEINRAIIKNNKNDNLYNINAGYGRDHTLQNENKNITNDNPDRPIKIKPIPELIGAFKTTSSKYIHLAGNRNFKWQRSYHDYIIRIEDEYDKISEYIRINPILWKEDKFFL